ncbi:MAG TPA: helix-turn-helix transcriptional regulator [Phycisphaerales bacterium]|nr:helix-turn-helix transcriptional regulator [Phycisphaerales bacterium]
MQTTTAAPLPGVRSSDLLWAALTADSGSAVLVYDANGRIICANAAAARLLGVAGDELAQKSLHEVLPAPIAEERLAHARQVVETGAPVVLDGMLAGRFTRATLRAVRGESPQESRVLETIRPTSAGEGKPEGVVYARAKTDDEGALGQLTAREREVLVHIGRGLSTAEIASTLGRSTKTVEWHRVSLGNKLGITNRVELARIAIKAGVTSLED